jgi:hypothetical protein
MRYPWPFTRLDQIWAALQDQSLDEHLNGIGIAVGVLGVDYDITMSAMCQTETSKASEAGRIVGRHQTSSDGTWCARCKEATFSVACISEAESAIVARITICYNAGGKTHGNDYVSVHPQPI